MSLLLMPGDALSVALFRKIRCQNNRNEMPEDHGNNNQGYSHKNQVGRRGAQICLEMLPLFPKEIGYQNVGSATDCRRRGVIEKEYFPRHFGHARQEISGKGGNRGMNRAMKTDLAP